MPKIKIRQTDIAREAGSSLATVDRVLNRRPGVSKHTQKRILDAIQRLKGNHKDQPKQSRQYHFDFILPGGPNLFWRIIGEEAQATQQIYSDKGVTIQTHPIEGFNPQALASSILKLCRNSDGLAIVALENPLITEAVKDAYEAGVPVVTMVSDLSSNKRIGYVGLNNRAAGRTAGYLMGRFLNGREGKVALFEGSIDLSYRDHQERDLGFNDALREFFPNLKVAVRAPTHDSKRIAHDATRQLLDENSDILGIYNVGGGLRGNVQALLEKGRSKEIVCIGHELTSFNRQFLIDGALDAIIDQNPGFQTQEATRLLLNFHKNKGQAGPCSTPEVKIYLRENLP